MKLKNYQQKVIDTLKTYLNALNNFKAKYTKALEFDVDMARDYNFPKCTWKQATGRKVFRNRGGFTDFFPREDDFLSHKNLKKLIPNLDCFCDFPPTGGTEGGLLYKKYLIT